MQKITQKFYLFVAIIAVCASFVSCSSDDDSSELNGTVWIHDYDPDDETPSGSIGKALVFGSKTVDYYSLTENNAVNALISSYSYTYSSGTLKIGIKTGTIEGNTLYFNNIVYYKSDKQLVVPAQ